MKDVLDSLLDLNEYKLILEQISGNKSASVEGVGLAQKAHIMAAAVSHLGKKALLIVENELVALKLAENLRSFLGKEVSFFPARELILYDISAQSNERQYSRIAAITKLLFNECRFVVASVESLSQPLMLPQDYKKYYLEIKLGMEIEIDALISALVLMGYERTEIVEGCGQFAVRGGIVDIFPVTEQKPVRIEFFDIEIDSMRLFNIETQRSFNTIKKIIIAPAKEILFSHDEGVKISKRIKRAAEQYISEKNPKGIENLKKTVDLFVSKAADSMHSVSCIDKWIPFVLEKSATLISYLGDNSILFVDEYSKVLQQNESNLSDFYERCRNMLEKGYILPESFNIHVDLDDILKIAKNRPIIEFHKFKKSMCEIPYCDKLIKIESRTVDNYNGNLKLMANDIEKWQTQGYRIFLALDSQEKIQLIKKFFTDMKISFTYENDVKKEKNKYPVVLKIGVFSNGFLYTGIKLTVLCDRGLEHKKKIRRRFRDKNFKKIDLFTDLKKGDYIVHQVHGIGIYEGIEKLTVDGTKKDYLKISYKDSGYLYVPVTQMDMVQKYIGAEGKRPKINKLGSSDWAKTKKRVKESLKSFASELIRLQAKRNARKGYVYSPDTVWQKEFEELFPYEETPDQLRCISEIKEDMESEKIMDRLLCGDVGYGKTEVALRAIFKAVMDGKQVAFLVPTTILAAQHYETFKERFSKFPVNVAVLSRFVSAAEQKKIIRGIKTGNIDVLIGTHKLFNTKVKFKALGLLIIDEEQRFGVFQKEKIKSQYPYVDILTLTATPIPRTLHMALSGLRDISTIEQPPAERIPVQTYVMEFDPDIVRNAVIREIARGGQVFYLYNSVKEILAKKRWLRSILPEIKICIAHGQMSEAELETVMQDFILRQYDVLLCTTIIESGMDMPNVNTIIVEDADKMGLAQLYQLRGRVGRSNRIAYAYLTFRREKVLKENAEKRLNAIKEFTEFGSGFKIAMRDLQIRGGGNILGAEQHGHMNTVGYDMYCRLLNEAISELKGEKGYGSDENEVLVDIKVDAYIDSSYIKDEKQRITMYKTIATIENQDDAMEIKDELFDRYGDIPKEVLNLIEIALIKNLAKECGISQIKQQKKEIMLFFLSKDSIPFDKLGTLIEQYKGRLLFSAAKNLCVSYKMGKDPLELCLKNIKIILQTALNLKLEGL